MQKFIEDNYQLILDVCKLITPNYTDLAHDLVIKLNGLEPPSHNKNLRAFFYYRARNLFIDNLRREYKYCELFEEPPNQDNETLVDPYEYIKRINQSELDELEKLWLTTYLDFEGKFCDIAKEIRVSRQTISKKIKESCRKLNG